MRSLLAAATAGCDLFSGPRFSGTVVDAVSGEPIEGIYMSVRTIPSGVGYSSMIASDLTDAEGRYRIDYDGINVVLYANYTNLGEDGPVNPAYDWVLVQSEDGVVRLPRINGRPIEGM